MNSAEQMDYKHVAPSDEEIQHTISFIRKKLDEPGFDSAEIKSGYEAAVNILENQVKSADQFPSHLMADKSKAIAILLSATRCDGSWSGSLVWFSKMLTAAS